MPIFLLVMGGSFKDLDASNATIKTVRNLDKRILKYFVILKEREAKTESHHPLSLSHSLILIFFPFRQVTDKEVPNNNTGRRT
jgi:hypothetical protein